MPVPTTAVFSRLDGVVPWRACINTAGRRSENVEVYSSHIGMGHNAAVLWVIADRLAQPEGAWRRFRAPSFAGHVFPGRKAAA
jgi:hypothetical protein